MSTLPEILDYEIIDNPGDANAVLLNVKEFAEDHGWTIDEWRTGYYWDGYNGGWVAAPGGDGQTGSFLMMHTTGYGGSWNMYRLFFRDEPNYTEYGFFGHDHYGPCMRAHYGQHSYANRTYTVQSSDPTHQNSLLHNNGYNAVQCVQSLQRYPVKQIICGNERYIHCMLQDDDFHCNHFFIGFPLLFDMTSTVFEGMVMLSNGVTGAGHFPNTNSGTLIDAYNSEHESDGSLPHVFSRQNSAGICMPTLLIDEVNGLSLTNSIASKVGTSLSVLYYWKPPQENYYGAPRINSYGDQYGKMLLSLNYANSRILIQDTIFAKRVSTGRFYPVGKTPWSFTNFLHNAPGDIITSQDGNDYILLPWWKSVYDQGWSNYSPGMDYEFVNGLATIGNIYAFAYRIA